MTPNSPAPAAETAALWNRCLQYLKSTLSYNEFVRLVQPATVSFDRSSIQVVVADGVIGRSFINDIVPRLQADILNAGVTVEVRWGDLWPRCLAQLQKEFPPQDVATWLLPLHALQEGALLRLHAPNRYVVDWVNDHAIERIKSWLEANSSGEVNEVSVEIGSVRRATSASSATPPRLEGAGTTTVSIGSRLNPDFTFANFIEGRSNQLARAAALQVAKNAGDAYNPLFIYGGVGLGKTHLMQAVGNLLRAGDPQARIGYVHSETFVSELVKALQQGALDEFKERYRALDALLIDDIQFFARSDRSQEEFFHTFNALLEGRRQLILTCDRYPKEVNLEERLKSRFGWGLTVAVEPPELETCVAILKSKAALNREELPDEVAFFIAKRFRSNVRDLEGALRRLMANSRFTARPITMELAEESLRDLLAVQDRMMTIENIQATVAAYYKIRRSDLLARDRSRAFARPRQMAMALCRELSTKSLAEIGDEFDGRDNTTVLHACRQVQELRASNARTAEDYANLLRTLSA